MQVTAEEIRKIISSSKIIPDPSKISDDTNLHEIGIDSLDIFTLYLKIEEHFNIKIPDDDVDRLTDINLIVTYINSKL